MARSMPLRVRWKPQPSGFFREERFVAVVHVAGDQVGSFGIRAGQQAPVGVSTTSARRAATSLTPLRGWAPAPFAAHVTALLAAAS